MADQEELELETPDIDDELAPVTPITPDMDLSTPESDVVKPKFNFMDSTLGKYLVEKQHVQLEVAKDIGRGFGRVGLRLLGTLQSEDLSVDEKIAGTLAGVVDAAGEVVKASIQIGSVGGLLHMVPGEATGKATDAFINGAVDSATGLIAERKTDKAGSDIYGLNASGIDKFTSKAGLIGVGVDAAVVGVDAAMDSANTHSKAYLDKNPDSKYTQAAGLVQTAHEAYVSPAGKMAKEKAARAAVKKLTEHFV